MAFTFTVNLIYILNNKNTYYKIVAMYYTYIKWSIVTVCPEITHIAKQLTLVNKKLKCKLA
jgi:hypothetical protein